MPQIVHVVLGKANPERMNGINRISHNLARSQHLAGRETELWGITRTPDAATPEREYGLRLFPPGPSRFAGPAGFAQALDGLSGPAVFHLHGGLLPEFHAVTRRLARRGLPWVVTPHGCYGEVALQRRRRVKQLYLRLFDRSVAMGARALQANTDEEAEELRALFPGQRICVIPNGQSLEELAFTPRELERPARPVFGFCGRLDRRHKGLDLLIQGFAQYRRTGGGGALWLVGDGPDRRELEQLAQSEGVADSTWFHGPRFGEDKCNRVAQMDVFVHTSRHEGMPMAVLEAAALERPLLVSRGTNLGEPVERRGAGIVLAENEPRHIAQALRSFERRTPRELAELGRAGRRMVLDEFSWEQAAARCVRELYGLAEPADALARVA